MLKHALLIVALMPVLPAQENTAKPKAPKKRKPEVTAIAFIDPPLSIKEKGHQLDFPAVAQDNDGNIKVVFTDYDGNSDQLKFASVTDEGFRAIESIGEPGIIHDPCIAIDQKGNNWVFWGQTVGDVVELKGCATGAGNVFTVAKSNGSETFADAGVDASGRVWVTWQSMRNTRPDIYTRYLDPQTGEWSGEIRVSENPEGDWEPKLAFDTSGNPWIIYDSAKGNEFNLYLAKVSNAGVDKTYRIAHSAQYEARASIAPTADGTGFWITAERGKTKWALDSRGHKNSTGINSDKSILFGKFDIASEQFEDLSPLHAANAGIPVNLPAVGVAPDGHPWICFRYFSRVLWQMGIIRYDLKTKQWSTKRRIEGGTFGQDRTSGFITGPNGDFTLCWSSDLRKTKAAQESGVFLASIDHAIDIPEATPDEIKAGWSAPVPVEVASHSTPERAFTDRHHWKSGSEQYGLYWGDVHRHTDVSNCRTGFDGCINEHFRYAYDIGKLDFMGTSDHTDIGKPYDPYEWWHNQKMHDVFHTPGRFNSLYVYEREQRWPWGHRNVVFAERGGPIIYIQRTRYRNSIWQKNLPIAPGVGEITPYELWDALKRSGKKVAVVSHTGATGMGTDWGRYDKIDHDFENLVEIFQGARVSYEGEGAPQPTVGHMKGEPYTIARDGQNSLPPPAPITDFGKYKSGTYQHALALHRRLGVFASSDHISSHVSYGGVYCKEFTRDGIIEAFKERRTIAATDKIYLEFSCNDRLLGSIFSTKENPKLQVRVDGTAKLKRVTIVRNEKNWKAFSDITGNKFETSVADEAPPEGENRYYIRVEQEDGNMAWSSPVWVVVES